MEWVIRELAAEETHPLCRAVSADGRIDLLGVSHKLDSTQEGWHLGVVDQAGQVIATSSFYPVLCPLRPETHPAMQLQFMAVPHHIFELRLGLYGVSGK